MVRRAGQLLMMKLRGGRDRAAPKKRETGAACHAAVKISALEKRSGHRNESEVKVAYMGLRGLSSPWPLSRQRPPSPVAPNQNSTSCSMEHPSRHFALRHASSGPQSRTSSACLRVAACPSLGAPSRTTPRTPRCGSMSTATFSEPRRAQSTMASGSSMTPLLIFSRGG